MLACHLGTLAAVHLPHIVRIILILLQYSEWKACVSLRTEIKKLCMIVLPISPNKDMTCRCRMWESKVTVLAADFGQVSRKLCRPFFSALRERKGRSSVRSFQMDKAANLQPHAAEAFAVAHPLIHAAKSSYFNLAYLIQPRYMS